jgi:predicted RND superfamily exporter protein
VTYFNAALVGTEVQYARKQAQVRTAKVANEGEGEGESGHATIKACHIPIERRRDLITRVFTRVATFCVSGNGIKALVVVIFAALGTLGGMGTSELKEGLLATDLFPDDSYLVSFLHQMNTNYAHLGTSVSINLPALDYSSADTATAIESLTQVLEISPTISHAYPTTSVWRSFRHASSSMGVVVSPQNKTLLLRAFLGLDYLIYDGAERVSSPLPPLFVGAGRAFQGDVAFANTSTSTSAALSLPAIVASRLRADHLSYIDSMDHLNAMKTLRSEIREAVVQSPALSKDDGDVFPYSARYVVYEQYDIVGAEAMTSLWTSALAVLAVLLIFMHAACAIIVFLTVALIDVMLLGWLVLMNLRINSVTTGRWRSQ